MHPAQKTYQHAKAHHAYREAEANARKRRALCEMREHLTRDWEQLAATNIQIEEELGLPASSAALGEAIDALLLFAWEWVSRHGTPEQIALLKEVLHLPLASCHEAFLEACLTLPEEYPVESGHADVAAFFEHQHQLVEEELRQSYAWHHIHLVSLEQALASIRADRTAEALPLLLNFSLDEKQRRVDQARLQAVLGRIERSPHQDQQEVLLRHLSEAMPQSRLPEEEEDPA